jgi:hypothetical protein
LRLRTFSSCRASITPETSGPSFAAWRCAARGKATERIEAAQAIAARGLPVAVAPGMIVSGYSPLKSEISPMPCCGVIADAGPPWRCRW